MIMLFKKKGGVKPIEKALLKELVEKISGLGYDVGYHHHSEIGWVSSAYNDLMGRAAAYGVENTLREYYLQGKAGGAESRRHEHLTQGKVATPEQTPLPIVTRLPPACRMVEPPAATSAPRSIDRPKMVDRPKALDGFTLTR